MELMAHGSPGSGGIGMAVNAIAEEHVGSTGAVWWSLYYCIHLGVSFQPLTETDVNGQCHSIVGKFGSGRSEPIEAAFQSTSPTEGSIVQVCYSTRSATLSPTKSSRLVRTSLPSLEFAIQNRATPRRSPPLSQPRCRCSESIRHQTTPPDYDKLIPSRFRKMGTFAFGFPSSLL